MLCSRLFGTRLPSLFHPTSEGIDDQVRPLFLGKWENRGGLRGQSASGRHTMYPDRLVGADRGPTADAFAPRLLAQAGRWPVRPRGLRAGQLISGAATATPTPLTARRLIRRSSPARKHFVRNYLWIEQNKKSLIIAVFCFIVII